MQGIIGLLIAVALIGLVVWAITTLVPMDAKFKQIIYVIAVVVTVLFVLSAFGLLPSGIGAPRVGR